MIALVWFRLLSDQCRSDQTIGRWPDFHILFDTLNSKLEHLERLELELNQIAIACISSDAYQRGGGRPNNRQMV